jgi:isopentenyl diphosphate isomerase/L-lactate dehydrogenase-like FMN-dependent dehydrogenase
MVGRPTCWGLAAAGEDGVLDVLRILRAELENTMALAGVGSVADITGAFVARA